MAINAIYAQIPNPSFETWTGGNPDGWKSLNAQTIPNMAGSVMQETNTPYDLSSCANIISKSFTLGPTTVGFPGVLTTGTTGSTITGGANFTERPLKVVGYFKYHTDSITDDAVFEVSLQLAGSNIATGSFISTGNVSVWTKFEVPLTYTSASNPDKIIITFYSSTKTSGAAKPGSMLTVDAIATEGSTTGINNNTISNTVKVYPTIASDYLFINLSENSIQNTTVEICNLNGQILQTETLQKNELNKNINVSNIAKGLYLVRVTNEKINSTQKISIQ